MLNFNEDNFARVQRGAVALAEPIHILMGELLARGKSNVHFVGAGGAGILMMPAAQYLQRHSRLPVFLDYPAELVETDSVSLTSSSIVIIPSLSGTTPESIGMLEFAKAKGATVITLTGCADSPLGRDADFTFTNLASDETSSESFYIQSIFIALSIQAHLGEIDDYDESVAQLQRLPQLLVGIKAQSEEKAATLASEISEDDYHIITGAGSAWPEAFYYGMCILEEMQWIRTRPVHASDFFHGTLELVEKGVSVILLKGEDTSRPLADRVESFVPLVTEKFHVIDSADYALKGVQQPIRALVSPVILATVLERVSAHLEVLRRHPLVTRRYYRRINY